MANDPVVRLHAKDQRGTGAEPARAAVPASASHNLARNEGAPLQVGWFENARVNLSAVERRAATLTTRRSVKKQWQAAWLVKAITVIDLTTLSGDDTPSRVQRLCAKARNPLRHDLVDGLGLDHPPAVGAVCVYPTMVRTAVKALEGSGWDPLESTCRHASLSIL